MTGAQPGRTPFTVLQLATLGLDGAPKVRGVILRSADAEQGAVSFFTDLRSAKIEEMRHQPRVSLIGYDPGAGFQIRLEGNATIDTEGPERAAAWTACKSHHTRALFQHPLPSGTAIAAPTQAAPARDGDGERHFAVVVVSVIRIDWLDVLDLCTCARCFGATAAIGVAAGLRLRRLALRSSAARRLRGRRSLSGAPPRSHVGCWRPQKSDRREGHSSSRRIGSLSAALQSRSQPFRDGLLKTQGSSARQGCPNNRRTLESHRINLRPVPTRRVQKLFQRRRIRIQLNVRRSRRPPLPAIDSALLHFPKLFTQRHRITS